MKQKYILENPFADVQPVGKPKKGKRVASALLGSTDMNLLINTLRNLPTEQPDTVISSVGSNR